MHVMSLVSEQMRCSSADIVCRRWSKI